MSSVGVRRQYLTANMGRKHFVANQCRGKYKKQEPPSRASTVSSESTSLPSDNTAGAESQTNQETTRSPPEETCVHLEGCRIINLQELSTFITKIFSHPSTCHGELSLVGETYCSGLASVLSAKCSGCRMEVAFPTSSK